MRKTSKIYRMKVACSVLSALRSCPILPKWLQSPAHLLQSSARTPKWHAVARAPIGNHPFHCSQSQILSIFLGGRRWSWAPGTAPKQHKFSSSLSPKRVAPSLRQCTQELLLRSMLPSSYDLERLGWCRGGNRYVGGWWGFSKRKTQTTQA